MKDKYNERETEERSADYENQYISYISPTDEDIEKFNKLYDRQASSKDSILSAHSSVQLLELAQKLQEGKPKQGIKNDENKLPYYTVLFKQFPNAIREVVKCSLSGHNKYEKTDTDWLNFLRVENADVRYKNAALRHMTEEGIVEDMKPYGEMLHEGAAIWDLLADLEVKLRNNK